MKNWILIPLAAVVGLIAGSWGPREDLKALQMRQQEARNVKTASDASGFNAFAKMVNIPDVAKRPHKPRQPATNAVAQTSQPSPTSQTFQASQPVQPSQPPRHFSREDLRVRIDEAAELWATRVELAKTQWKSKLGISGEQDAEAFESAIRTMNESLLETMTALAEEIDKAEKMTPELGLRLMGDASRVMAEAYDAIGAIVPAERRGEVSEMPVFEFIDPMVAEPIIGVQDKLPSDRTWHGGMGKGGPR